MPVFFTTEFAKGAAKGTEGMSCSDCVKELRGSSFVNFAPPSEHVVVKN
jgi:hypothetical protein